MNSTGLSRKFCVAPMMKRTDRHFRHLLRMLSRRAMLYTEMISTRAALSAGRAEAAFEPMQHPLALQLGGNDPGEMSDCARIAEDTGYDEVNINAGCPSQRVKKGMFGACLMLSPERVAGCVAAMSARVAIPVTVKCRIGVEQAQSVHNAQLNDELDGERIFAGLCCFVETVSAAGCATFIVHARKAILQGLTPKQNRRIPPLRHDLVRALKREFPQLEIILNGGIQTLSQAKAELRHRRGLGSVVDGVMLGRAVYKYPLMLAEVDALFHNEERCRISPGEIIGEYLEYLSLEIRRGVPAGLVTRHLMNWFRGYHDARRWRRYLSEELPKSGWKINFPEMAARVPVDTDMQEQPGQAGQPPRGSSKVLRVYPGFLPVPK